MTSVERRPVEMPPDKPTGSLLGHGPMRALPVSLQRVAHIGAEASDPPDLRLRKEVLVLSSTLWRALSCLS